jgi:hypothetical protein
VVFGTGSGPAVVFCHRRLEKLQPFGQDVPYLASVFAVEHTNIKGGPCMVGVAQGPIKSIAD